MKTIKYLSVLFLAVVTLNACSSDDDNTPPPAVNEEEVITTLTVTLTPSGGGNNVTFVYRDLDGDGPNNPVITNGTLAANTTYSGAIKLENETENPAENITEEVEEEANEHQFFYTVASTLNVTATATNTDGNGNPLGTQFSLVTGAASSGNLTFTLRHEPTKPNTGLDNAGGETDIAATFDATIQ